MLYHIEVTFPRNMVGLLDCNSDDDALPSDEELTALILSNKIDLSEELRKPKETGFVVRVSSTKEDGDAVLAEELLHQFVVGHPF